MKNKHYIRTIKKRSNVKQKNEQTQTQTVFLKKITCFYTDGERNNEEPKLSINPFTKDETKYHFKRVKQDDGHTTIKITRLETT